MRPKIPSRRIHTIVDQLRPAQPVYDLCCDHGLIGLLAWNRNPDRSIIFADQSADALVPLQTELEKPRYQKAPIRVHVGPAEDLHITSPSNIVIAGVGNATIMRILNALIPQDLGEHRLILCSQQLITPLRTYLHQRSWPIQKVIPVDERGRLREVLCVEMSPP